jgi:hypothetical protein
MQPFCRGVLGKSQGRRVGTMIVLTSWRPFGLLK